MIEPSSDPLFLVVCDERTQMATCTKDEGATGAAKLMAFRKKSYKKSLSTADGRARRTQNSIQLRKNKRIMGLAKKRNIKGREPAASTAAAAQDASSGADDGATGAVAAGRVPCTLVPNEVSLEHLSVFCDAAHGDSPQLCIEGVRQIRRLLSKEADPPVTEVLNTGVLPRLGQFLGEEFSEVPILQFESAWALTNIASTEHTSVVVELGVVPALVALLRSTNADVREQCCWALGNIAGDGYKYRDMVLSVPGAVDNLVLNIAHPATLSLLRNAVWTLSNFCRGKPAPSLEASRPLLEVLSQLLTNDDSEVLTDTCWALSYLSDGDDERIQVVIDTGIIDRLIELLGHTSTAVVTPALRTVGNFVSGADEQTQVVVDHGGVPAFVQLLTSSKRNIRKEACWALSNVAAGTPAQVASLTGHTELIPRLVHLLGTAEWSVKKESAWAISNMLTTGPPGQVEEMVAAGVIEPLCALLEVDDNRITLVALGALDCILKAGAAAGVGDAYTEAVEAAGGVDAIERLQEHNNKDIFSTAVKLIEDFFGVDGEMEDENLVPNTVEGSSTFAFGVSSAQNAGAPALPAPSFGFGASAGFGAPAGGGFQFGGSTQ